jgi:hypothetical protein
MSVLRYRRALVSVEFAPAAPPTLASASACERDAPWASAAAAAAAAVAAVATDAPAARVGFDADDAAAADAQAATW